jgi:acid phosphatase family membrane protein YuiD
MTALSPILAHQGGWDEMLFVIAPIVLIIGILAVVKRRVDRMGPPPPT